MECQTGPALLRFVSSRLACDPVRAAMGLPAPSRAHATLAGSTGDDVSGTLDGHGHARAVSKMVAARFGFHADAVTSGWVQHARTYLANMKLV